jgi:hypothetical protein
MEKRRVLDNLGAPERDPEEEPQRSHGVIENGDVRAVRRQMQLKAPDVHSPNRISLPRKSGRVGLRIVLFEVCSAFTRVTVCTLALSPIRDTHTEGFSHFVTSMTAPVASGWSGCRVGLTPTGKRRLSTAHTQLGHSPVQP